MKKSIWKFPLEKTGTQLVQMPVGAKILSVQVQRNTPCIWAEVDTEAELEYRAIGTFSTGEPMEDFDLKYIGTYQLFNGSLVFHVYITQKISETKK